MTRPQDFNREAALPPGLTIGHVGRAIDYIEQQLADFADIYEEQRNVFSALVGIFGVRALDAISAYKKNRNIDTAQQRFPDLKRVGAPDPPPPNLSLESKASKRPWELQSHYNHPGWYVVWRYLVDQTATIEPGRPVVIWRVDVAFLREEDWKYEASRAGEGRGGRTHTFGLRSAARRLRDAAVYSRSDIKLSAGVPVPKNGG